MLDIYCFSITCESAKQVSYSAVCRSSSSRVPRSADEDSGGLLMLAAFGVYMCGLEPSLAERLTCE